MPPSINKRIFVPVVALLLVFGLAAISLVYTNTSNQQNPGQTTDQSPNIPQSEVEPDPSTPASESTRANVSPFLENLDVLSTVYTDVEYFFINQSSMEFADREFSNVNRFAIDPVSFGLRSDGNYSFSVIDGDNGTRLFYVIIFRNADGGITVEQYL